MAALAAFYFLNAQGDMSVLQSYSIQIEIPERLGEMLLKNNMDGRAHSAVRDFSVWLADNKTPFFYEYTDHGVAHITNVLRSVESLISSKSWAVIQSEDIEAIIAAVLLHDCAMHLSLDGFFTLLDEQAPVSSLVGDEPSWAEEFSRFEQEAARWDAPKLMSVFGDTDPAQPLRSRVNVSDRQKMMIGEFLRRNHARLAHEISLSGVPGPAGVRKFDPFSGYDSARRDLFGLLARSHNMGIRSAVDVLPKISRRRYIDVHAPYIMSLLRIADYIQIDAARAPTQILQLRGLKSPLSRAEWAKHHAVLELHQLGEDPEALNVVAVPGNVVVFSGLRALFKDLQRELDESWAVLGEVYGRFDRLNDLGLTVRRLVSNLDNPEQFEKDSRPNFIPKELRMTTSSAELLHLLVGPLYGNNPSIGVRELLQNAIDATAEMGHQASRVASTCFTPSIEVELDVASSKESFLRITDNGVGMSLEVLEDYFLKAGASFRRSKWWIGEYIEDSKVPKVRRSGRFGVGALAAFLLGPTITVTTRNFLDTSGFGYKFSISLDDDLIEVAKVKAEIGTSIAVRLSPTSSDELVADKNYDIKFSDWYVYKRPQIKYRVNRKGSWDEVIPRKMVEDPVITDKSVWVPLDVQEYESILWTYEESLFRSRRSLFCNGIYVASSGYNGPLPKMEISGSRRQVFVDHPDILVDDRIGLLPLNVQRNGLVQKKYPFQDALEESIAEQYVRDLISALKIRSHPKQINSAINACRRVAKKYGGSGASIGLLSCGWFPIEDAVLSGLAMDTCVIELFDSASFDGYISNIPISEMDGCALIPVVGDSSGSGVSVAFMRTLMETNGSWNMQNPLGPFHEIVIGARFFVNKSVEAAMLKPRGFPQFLMRRLNEVFRDDDWIVYEVGTPGKVGGNLNEVISRASSCSARVFAYFFLDPGKKLEQPETKFSRQWLKQVGESTFQVAESILTNSVPLVDEDLEIDNSPVR